MKKYIFYTMLAISFLALSNNTKAQSLILLAESDGIWQDTKNVTADVWDGTKEVTSDVWDGAKKVTSDVWDGTKKVASDVKEGIDGDKEKMPKDNTKNSENTPTQEINSSN